MKIFILKNNKGDIMKNFLILFFFFYAIGLQNESDAQWMQTNGPDGGSVWSLTVSESNIFAGGNGGGVFLSTNDGATWTTVNDGLTNTYVYSLAASGTNLFAGTPDGVFLSTNNGTNWTHSGLTGLSIDAIAIIGTNIFVGTHSTGVFRSTNNGANWIQVISGMTSLLVRALAVSGTNLFAGTYGGGVFLSTNNGESWTAVNGTLTSNDKYIYSFAVDGTDLYAGSYTGVFLSTNNGTSWTPLSNGLPSNPYVYGLGKNGSNMFAATWNGIYLSTNSGANWTQINLGIDPPVSLCIAVKGSIILSGTLGNGVFRSSNNGSNWASSNTGIRNSLLVSTAYINSTLFATSSYDGIFASTDNGNNWSSRNTGITYLYINAVYSFGADIFAASYGGGVFVSTNNGANWSAANSGLTNLNAYAFTSIGSNLFVGTYGGGVFISTNNGTNWTSVNSGITNLNVTALLVNGTDIYAGTWNGGVFKSTNNGTSWTAVNTGLTTNSSKQIASLIASVPNILAGTTEGVYLSSNNGGNWTKITSGISGTWISDLTSSGTNVFAGTREASVYLSVNNGFNWTKISDGFTTSADVYGLAASSTELYAGTFGSSVWKRPLSEIIGGPGVAVNPNPPDSATNVDAINLILSWSNPTGATANKVFFGTSPATLTEIHSGSLVTSINAPSPLTYNSTYYWRVDEIDASGTTIGNLWSFTVMDDPSAVTLFLDDFESGLTNWTITNQGTGCDWQIFLPPYPSPYGPYTLPPTSSGGVLSADAAFCGAQVLSTATLNNPVDATDYLYVEIQFDNDWRHYVSGDQAHVQVSTDSITWTSVWSRIGVSQRNTHEIVDISNYVAESSFWIRFKSVQPTWDYWWVIDNVQIRGLGFVPVELTSFTASVLQNNILLSWATATELNNLGFEIERRKALNIKSETTSGWEKIGFVEGNGTTTELKSYSFTDENVITGRYNYRLKQIDFDGTFVYSNEIEVDADFTPTEYVLYQNYPNPFNPTTTIKYSLPFESEVKIVVHNLLGEKIMELVNGKQGAGYYEVNWDAGSIASGIYFYTIEAKAVDTGQNYKTVKKMILLR
jgi:hypothetical protein